MTRRSADDLVKVMSAQKSMPSIDPTAGSAYWSRGGIG
jgi:hypothetical protein